MSGCLPGVPDRPDNPGTLVFLGPFRVVLGTFEPRRSLWRLCLWVSKAEVRFRCECRPRTPPGAVKPASGSPETAQNADFYGSFSVPRFGGPGNSQTPSLRFGPVQMQSRGVPASDPDPPGLLGVPENRQKGPGKCNFRVFYLRIARARLKPESLP